MSSAFPRPSGIETLDGALSRTVRFTYDYVLRLIGLSVAWIVVSLPIVTIGPATLAAYASILSLREHGRIDRPFVLHTLQKRWLDATVLGLLPAVFGLVAISNVALYLRTGVLVFAAVSVVCVYATVYLILVLIPTFIALANGYEPVTALKTGHGWVNDHPTLSITTALLTLALLALSLVLTVGFVLLFAALAFTLHVEIIEGDHTING
jgi:hypothetical protein